MTERGQPVADAAMACPFVAFEDERDERSTRPDPRHRCYAEARPAPRALAHQDAYCLSPSFVACPTFQDWARREAARARRPSASVRGGRGGRDADGSGADEAPPRGRGWMSPPPWVDRAGLASRADRPEPDRPEPDQDADDVGADGSATPGTGGSTTGGSTTEAEALAGSVGGELWATGSIGGAPGSARHAGRDDAPVAGRNRSADDELGSRRRDRPTGEAPDGPSFLATRDRSSERGRERAGLAGSAALAAAGGSGWADEAEDAEEENAEAAPAARAGSRPIGDRPIGSTRREAGGRRGGVARPARDDDAERTLRGPSWERPRRFEAYPTLRTRVGLPNVPGVALGFAALIVAALALFFIPPLLLKQGSGGIDTGAGASSTPAASAGSSESAAPTPVPSPTPQVYTIVAGDTLSTVAQRFHVPLADLIAANPKIKNPDRVNIGDEVIIPAPSPSGVLDTGGGASASPSGP